MTAAVTAKNRGNSRTTTVKSLTATAATTTDIAATSAATTVLVQLSIPNISRNRDVEGNEVLV
jgi:hypothetical protein